MVRLRRALLAVLAVGLVAAGVAGWWLLSASPSERAEADDGGCAERADGSTDGPAQGMLVCRYDSAGTLDRSSLLSPEETVAAEAALAAGAAAGPDCVPEDTTPASAVLVSQAHRAVLSLDRVCSTYVLDAGQPRRVSAEVRAWAQADAGG